MPTRRSGQGVGWRPETRRPRDPRSREGGGRCLQSPGRGLWGPPAWARPRRPAHGDGVCSVSRSLSVLGVGADVDYLEQFGASSVSDPRGVSRAAPCHCHTEASPTLPEPRRPCVHAWPGLATPGGTKAGRVPPEPLVCSLFSAAPRSQHSPVPGLTLSRAGCGRTLATSCRVP